MNVVFGGSISGVVKGEAQGRFRPEFDLCKWQLSANSCHSAPDSL